MWVYPVQHFELINYSTLNCHLAIHNNKYLLYNKKIIEVFNDIIINNTFNIEEIEFNHTDIKIVIRTETNIIKNYIN